MRYRWHAAIDRIPENEKLIIAEIGVWTGRFTEKLATARPDVKIIQIDRWKSYTKKERKAEGYTDYSLKDQANYDKAKYKNKKRIQSSKFLQKRIITIEKDSLSAAKYFEDNYFYIVFIDAGHSFKSCLEDIKIWLPKVITGGYIGGHDYPDRPGVKKAVDLMFGDRVITDADKTWWVKKI